MTQKSLTLGDRGQVKKSLLEKFKFFYIQTIEDLWMGYGAGQLAIMSPELCPEIPYVKKIFSKLAPDVQTPEMHLTYKEPKF